MAGVLGFIVTVFSAVFTAPIRVAIWGVNTAISKLERKSGKGESDITKGADITLKMLRLTLRGLERLINFIRGVVSVLLTLFSIEGLITLLIGVLLLSVVSSSVLVIIADSVNKENVNIGNYIQDNISYSPTYTRYLEGMDLILDELVEIGEYNSGSSYKSNALVSAGFDSSHNQVRKDCSGYVTAVLAYTGVLENWDGRAKGGYAYSKIDLGASDMDVVPQREYLHPILESVGKFLVTGKDDVNMDNWSPRKGDILSYANGHVEIVGDFTNNVWRVYSWGKVYTKDNKYGYRGSLKDLRSGKYMSSDLVSVWRLGV